MIHLLNTVTDSTPFRLLDMAFHVWLIGHLLHHVVSLVPAKHRHLRNWLAR